MSDTTGSSNLHRDETGKLTPNSLRQVRSEAGQKGAKRDTSDTLRILVNGHHAGSLGGQIGGSKGGQISSSLQERDEFGRFIGKKDEGASSGKVE